MFKKASFASVISCMFAETIGMMLASTKRLNRNSLFRNLALVRRLWCPKTMRTAASSPKVHIPAKSYRDLSASRENERTGGMNQYQTPRIPTMTVTIDGPTPKYHAEKTSAAQRV